MIFSSVFWLFIISPINTVLSIEILFNIFVNMITTTKTIVLLKYQANHLFRITYKLSCMDKVIYLTPYIHTYKKTDYIVNHYIYIGPISEMSIGLSFKLPPPVNLSNHPLFSVFTSSVDVGFIPVLTLSDRLEATPFL